MRVMVLIVLLVMLPISATADAPTSRATAFPIGARFSSAQSPTLVATPHAGAFDPYLAGAFVAGAFVGAVVIQAVASAVLVPALLLAAPPAGAAVAAVSGGGYVYDAISMAGGIGGGLLGTWLYSSRCAAQ